MCNKSKKEESEKLKKIQNDIVQEQLGRGRREEVTLEGVGRGLVICNRVKPK